MAVIQRTIDVPAGEVNENILAGSAFEFIRARSVVQMAVVSASGSDNFVTIQIGPRILAEEFNPVQSAAYPTIPDDFYYAAGAVPGDRLVIRVRNANAAAQTCRVVVQITEV